MNGAEQPVQTRFKPGSQTVHVRFSLCSRPVHKLFTFLFTRVCVVHEVVQCLNWAVNNYEHALNKTELRVNIDFSTHGTCMYFLHVHVAILNSLIANALELALFSGLADLADLAHEPRLPAHPGALEHSALTLRAAGVEERLPRHVESTAWGTESRNNCRVRSSARRNFYSTRKTHRETTIAQ